jgi:hypothetical protein
MDESSRRQPLRRGWPYRLRVHIGQPDQTFSAIEGEVPPIDALLPDVAPDATLAIDVVVFEKSFALLSPGLQTLRLPPYGGTRPVYFEVRTPLQPGPADLRIALYHGNNLLQSFVLEAWIGEREASSPEANALLVSVRLASSGTAKFGNLRQLGERALSIALNDDVRGGTHTLMVKRGTLRESIALTEKQVEQHMREFRDLLQTAMNATGSHAERLFAVDGQASLEREQQFTSCLRQFARIGHDIWSMLVERPGVDTAALLALQQGRGETLQFVRHGRMLPFPWQTVYDYPLPQGTDFEKARVCLGDVPVVRQLGPRDTGCPHRPGEAVVCIEGFWSVRHAVEQLTEDRERSAPGAAPGSSGDRAEDRVTAIDVPPGNPLVCLGVGNDDLPARSLQKQLEAHFGAPDLRVLKEGDDPLEELLWKAASRPGLLIVISHLQPGDTANNLPARIAAVVSNPPFQPNVITGPGLLQQKLHFKE